MLVASPNLNRVEGDPHVVKVSLYPLQNVAAFNATDPIDRRGGTKGESKFPGTWDETVFPAQYAI